MGEVNRLKLCIVQKRLISKTQLSVHVINLRVNIEWINRKLYVVLKKESMYLYKCKREASCSFYHYEENTLDNHELLTKVSKEKWIKQPPQKCLKFINNYSKKVSKLCKSVRK